MVGEADGRGPHPRRSAVLHSAVGVHRWAPLPPSRPTSPHAGVPLANLSSPVARPDPSEHHRLTPSRLPPSSSCRIERGSRLQWTGKTMKTMRAVMVAMMAGGLLSLPAAAQQGPGGVGARGEGPGGARGCGMTAGAGLVGGRGMMRGGRMMSGSGTMRRGRMTHRPGMLARRIELAIERQEALELTEDQAERPRELSDELVVARRGVRERPGASPDRRRIPACPRPAPLPAGALQHG